MYHDDGAGVTVAVAAAGTAGDENVGVLYVCAADELAALNMTPSELCRWLADENPSDMIVSGQVKLPDGRIVRAELDADADSWVIASVNGVIQDRDLTAWPRLSGWIAEP